MVEPVNLKDPRLWLEMAVSKLNHARKIFEIDLYDDAISRAYYAMYYAAKSALLTEGVDLRKHSAAIAKFSELFVKTGRVEAEYVRYLGQAEGARGRSDYAPFMQTSREGAAEILSAAEAFVNKVEEVVTASQQE